MEHRLATTSDAAALADLRWTWRAVEDAGDGHVDESRDAFRQRFSSFVVDALSSRWTVWVAVDQGEIVANIWIYRVPKVPSPGVATRDLGYMTNVYTAPAWRDRGVGTELLVTVKEWAHVAYLELIIVWPSDRSIPWYRRAGFSPPTDLLSIEIAGYEG